MLSINAIIKKRLNLKSIAVISAIAVSIFLCWQLIAPVYFVIVMRNIRSYPESMQRKYYHIMLNTSFSCRHDVWIGLISVGDESSVPILINSLLWEQDTHDGVMWCGKGHCLEALQSITNNKPGANYSDWRKWWAKNKRKSRYEWVIEGFRQKGLDIDQTPTDSSSILLMRYYLNSTDNHLSDNAWFILGRLPKDRLTAITEMSIKSSIPQQRQAAAALLARIGDNQAMSMLRHLTSDEDPGVREMSITFLNSIIRARDSKANQLQSTEKVKIGTDIGMISGSSDSSCLYFGAEMQREMGADSKVIKYNLLSKEKEWSFSCSRTVNSVPMIEKDRLYFCTDDGGVYCLGAENGELIWEHRAEGHPGYRPRNRTIILDSALIVTESQYLWALNKKDGRLLWKLNVRPKIGAVCDNSGFVFVINEGDSIMKISRGGKIAGIAASPGSAHCITSNDSLLYVIYGRDSSYLAAYSPSLRLKWERAIGKIWNWPQTVPVLINNTVIACSDDHVMAFNKNTGERVWSAIDSSDSPMYNYNGMVLIRNELRNVRSGEIYALLEGPRLTGEGGLITIGENLIYGDFSGNLTLLKMPKVTEH